MDAILHILGFCPDSISHADMVDMLIIYNFEIQFIFNKLKQLIK